ncbi:hypothetical protein ACQEVF_57875 [Nonomuraea polychroma]|uniref:hypothetical protein n=1 Tax=Nonomuraea polychroma TaxID=46176 RepID=UPI003D91BEA0
MDEPDPEQLQFPALFSHTSTYRQAGPGFFGTDVLRGLTDGIDEFLASSDGRWSRSRSLGPAMLGCVPWFDDPVLLDCVTRCPSACVVINKQELKKRGKVGFEALKHQADCGPGFPPRAFSSLTQLASRYNGDPPVLGPSSPEPPDLRIQTFRSFGFRKTGGRPVPILHAKMFLLGELWWHDEGPLGHVEDIVGFTPKRLWLGSTNATKSSRLSLEFGVWINDRALLNQAQEFLVQILRYSESIDPADDRFVPEFVSFDYDDEAFWEYYRDLDPDPGDE